MSRSAPGTLFHVLLARDTRDCYIHYIITTFVQTSLQQSWQKQAYMPVLILRALLVFTGLVVYDPTAFYSSLETVESDYHWGGRVLNSGISCESRGFNQLAHQIINNSFVYTYIHIQ